jgi:hypothetical protein
MDFKKILGFIIVGLVASSFGKQNGKLFNYNKKDKKEIKIQKFQCFKNLNFFPFVHSFSFFFFIFFFLQFFVSTCDFRFTFSSKIERKKNISQCELFHW